MSMFVKMSLMACMVASHPPSCPAHTCKGPAALRTSSFTMLITALAMIRLGTSPTPIGLTPGYLLSVMSRQATRALRPSGWKGSVQI